MQNKFCKICEIAHEKDIKTQEELTTCLNFYHDLGFIIYYGNANDIFLRNTIILRPQKLVEIFNQILRANMPVSFNKNNSFSGSLDNLSNSKFKNQFETHQSQSFKDNKEQNFSVQWIDLWQKFDKRGILDDNLLDILWKDVIDQKVCLSHNFGHHML